MFGLLASILFSRLIVFCTRKISANKLCKQCFTQTKFAHCVTFYPSSDWLISDAGLSVMASHWSTVPVAPLQSAAEDSVGSRSETCIEETSLVLFGVMSIGISLGIFENKLSQNYIQNNKIFIKFDDYI